MPKMSPAELKSLLASEKSDALAAVQSAKLSMERSDALDYYIGNLKKDMPTQDGRSVAVSMDVSDTVDGLMPSMMDIFAGSDEVVRFEPVGPEDEEAAAQETDYVNHVFMQQNDGFKIIHDFTKDALLQKVGVVKVWWDKYEKRERETYNDLGDDQYAMLAQDVIQSDGALEILEHTVKGGAGEQPDDGADAAAMGGIAPAVHDVVIQRTSKVEQAKVMGVPPEEFGIERNARSIKDCNYLFHKIPTQTEADLIAQGYDEDQVKKLPSYANLTNTEELSRDTVDEEYWAGGKDNSATRVVEITEHYIRLDYEGDGKPCLYKITTAGGQDDVLLKDGKPDIEEFDSMPFAAATPIPIPHRFFGRSIADIVMPTQRVKTALMRGMLDNLYLHNNPRVEVAEQFANENTLDDLLVSRIGGIVRTKQPGGLNWQVVPDITGSIYPALAYMDATREMSTGVTRQSQGVDANALQNQSATAVNQVFSMSQAKVKLLARNLSVGIRDMFSLLHQVIRKHGQDAQTVRLRNKWVAVDPRQWKSRNDLTINVGLGTGGKSERFAQTMALANAQKELLLGGKSNIVDDKKLFNTMAELAKILGHKNPDPYFNDPDEKDQSGQLVHPAPPPQPDPVMAKIQADVQLKQADMQMRGQEMQVKAQIDQQADERKAQIEQVQAQADIATQDRKMQSEMAMAQQKFELERELKLMEFQLKREQHQAEMEMKRELHQYTVANTQMGMVASAQQHSAKMGQASASE